MLSRKEKSSRVISRLSRVLGVGLTQTLTRLLVCDQPLLILVVDFHQILLCLPRFLEPRRLLGGRFKNKPPLGLRVGCNWIVHRVLHP